MTAAALVLGGLLGAATAATQATGAVQPEEVTFASGPLSLRGFLYRPEGPGPFPVVLWNHGSEPRPGWLPTLGPLFTARGYVFFIPHRRGQGRSPGHYIMDLLRREMERGGPDAWSRLLVSLQEVHLQDQLAALAFAPGLPHVDGRRVAIAGCSFGGIQTLLAAEEGHGARTAVAFAAAAQTWRHSFALHDRLRKAVRHAAVPLMLVQAQNDYDLEASRALAKEAEKAGRPATLRIFPPFGAARRTVMSSACAAPRPSPATSSTS
jgi:dienelactone hydrolase